MKKHLLLLLVLVVLACKNSEPAPLVFRVDPLLLSYFKNFIYEANIRNVKIDTSNLILEFTNLGTFAGNEYCGQCFQAKIKSEVQQKEIKITNNEVCWKNNQTYNKEALVSHELGHCLLGRVNHRTDVFKNDAPASIMNPSNFDLYIGCVYALDDDPSKCNFTSRRKYYIDELFNEKTPMPDWGK